MSQTTYAWEASTREGAHRSSDIFWKRGVERWGAGARVVRREGGRVGGGGVAAVVAEVAVAVAVGRGRG